VSSLYRRGKEVVVRRAILVAGLVALAVVVAACGYRFRGKTSNLPEDVRSIAVPMFRNHTGEARIESIFTDEVIFQFTRSQILRVVSAGRADAVLYGVITRADVEDVAYTAEETSRQRRITITVDLRLVRRRDGKVIWQRKDLKQQRTYSVSDDNTTTEANKQAAIEELAQDMAQTIHDSVLENF